MRVLVTGATGFIGGYVINELLRRGYSVIASSSDVGKARQKNWFTSVTYIEHDLNDPSTENLYNKLGKPDLMIHLAWGGLSDFKNESHLSEELPKQIKFVGNMLRGGLKDLTVTGTCLEYGMREGCLEETMEPQPHIAYPRAKDELRKAVVNLQNEIQFSFKWIRLFYMYGEGQTPKSILPQLQKALRNNEPVFNMSKGDQKRDYLPVESIAENIIIFATQQEIDGVINCSSNRPVTILKLVKDYLRENKKEIKLNPGFYPYPDYEPFEFWGDDKKQKKNNKYEPN